MLNKIRDHPTHTVLAIGMAIMGLFLMANDHYFIWPPYYAEWFNDDVFGFLFVADGITLLIWVLRFSRSAVANRAILTVSSSLLAALTTLQLLATIATGTYFNWISNAIITAFVLILARRSDRYDSRNS